MAPRMAAWLETLQTRSDGVMPPEWKATCATTMLAKAQKSGSRCDRGRRHRPGGRRRIGGAGRAGWPWEWLGNAMTKPTRLALSMKKALGINNHPSRDSNSHKGGVHYQNNGHHGNSDQRTDSLSSLLKDSRDQEKNIGKRYRQRQR